MLTVVIPGLCTNQIQPNQPLPGLSKLLQPYQQWRLNPKYGNITRWHRYEDWLQQFLPSSDDSTTSTPSLAQLLALQDGLKNPINAPAHWLCATPLEYKLMQDHIVAIDLSKHTPSTVETAALLASLNSYYASERLTFYAPHPLRWYIDSDRAPNFTATPPWHLWGQSVTDYLPQGPDALYWQRLQNEIQMLLFEHPVNQQREAQGLPPINSLWIWGPPLEASASASSPDSRPHSAHYSVVYTNEPCLTATARRRGVAAQGLPQQASELNGETSALVLLDQLALPLAYGDQADWFNQLYTLEKHWFYPLSQFNRYQQPIDLIIGDAQQLAQYNPTQSVITVQKKLSHWLRACFTRSPKKLVPDLAALHQALFQTRSS